MNILVADDIGYLKTCNFNKTDEDSSVDIRKFKYGSRDSRIEEMAFSVDGDSIWLAKKGGDLQEVDIENGSTKNRLEQMNGTCIGLHQTRHGPVVACTSSGDCHVFDLNEKAKNVKIDLGSDLNRMRISPCENVIAIGGTEKDLTLYDIGRMPEKDPIFKAKNVDDDWLGLRVPVIIHDMGYLSENSPHEIAVSTGIGAVRVFDTRESRLPVFSIEVGKVPLKHLCIVPGKREFLVSDNQGNLMHYDVSKQQSLGYFKGFSGAVTDIKIDADCKTVVSTSLDRHLRIHRIVDRKLLKKVYLKQKLHRVLLANHETEKVEDKSGEEDVWDLLEVEGRR